MSTSPSPSRHWLVRALWIVAGVVAVFATVFVIAVNLPDYPAAQNSTAATTPQEPDYPTYESPSPEATESPTPEPTPSATPTEAPPEFPDEGDERGCPDSSGDLDANDPFCKERDRDQIFATYFVDNPAYKCRDGRNKGLGIDDMDKFVPCINGSFRLELSSTRGAISEYQSTTRLWSVERKISDEAAAPDPNVTGVDWVVRQSKYNTDENGQFYRLRYFHNDRLKMFGVYYRSGAASDWKFLPYPNDKKFYTNTGYQVVVFWNDPDGSKVREAPLPPQFNWPRVEKPFSS